jgi:hypothetical protein
MTSLPTLKTMTLVRWFALALLWQDALGQGLGLVNLNNNFTPRGATAKALILGANGQPLARGLGSVEILDSLGNVIRSGHLVAAGIFAFGVVEIPGTVPGGNGSIQIRAWDGSQEDTFDTARIRTSEIVTLVGLGGGSIPAPGLGAISNFSGLWVVSLCPPEATTASVHIDWIVPVGDQVRVLANGNGGLSWALWSSTNLVDWTSAGAPQQSKPGWCYLVELEWTIPRPLSPTLYRVIQVPN